MRSKLTFALALAAWSLPILSAAPAGAAEGVTLINQTKALAGKVTPDDGPGFPVTLSAPGSYKLAGNLQVPAGTNGIVVAANHVTIDLNGFELAGGLTAANGIAAAGGNRSGVTVRNGTIFGFRRDGIRTTGSYWTVENMRIVNVGGNGIAAGHFLQVRDSNLWRSGLNGVIAVNQASVMNSTIVGSGASGVVCENHCLVSGSMISQNGQAGAGVGVSASLGTVLGNTITGNKGLGISGSATGYGNNTLVTNNSGGGAQVSDGLVPLQPNACIPAC